MFDGGNEDLINGNIKQLKLYFMTKNVYASKKD